MALQHQNDYPPYDIHSSQHLSLAADTRGGAHTDDLRLVCEMARD